MSDRSNPISQPLLEELSAFADGQLDHDAASRVAAKWRDCEETRKAWHSYHLIGDVLRSDELAGSTRDEAFLQALRARLAQEPVVLAPALSAEVDEHAHTAAVAAAGGGRPGRRRRWGAPAAVAAGFMVVAGALVVTRVDQSAAPVTALAVAAPEPAKAATVEQPVLVVNGELVRDAQLDRYLSAHKQFGGSTALGVPSGFLRSATYEAPSR
jgi:sigma-E factor negative regulatory protein RseA